MTKKLPADRVLKKIGRPPGDTLFVNKEKIKEGITIWISEGKTLRDYCKQEEMPSYPTIFRWLDEDPSFAVNYARARDIGFEILAEEALHIADTPRMGEKRVTHQGDDGEDAMTITEEEMLGHRKLQIDTRMRLLKAWHPKRYGDRAILAGDEDAPVAVAVSFDIFGELLKNMTMKRQTGD